MAKSKYLVAIAVTVLWCIAGLADEISDRATRLMEDEMNKQHIAGVASVVLVDSTIVYSRALGSADIENNVPASVGMVVRTGSLAKSITAVAALRLYQEGKLDLDAPVQKYCPALPQKEFPVTTRQLLGHLGGIRHYKPDYSDFISTKHFEKLTDSLEQFAQDPLVAEPGTKYVYSSNGYTVVGCVIEGVTGKGFFDAISDLVLKPAGMNATRVDSYSEIVSHRSRPYSRTKHDTIINAPFVDTSNKIPGGGLISTVEDLSRFVIALRSGKLLDDKTREMMWTSQQTRDGKLTTYGLGWNVRQENGTKTIEHGGTAIGSANSIFILPERGVTAIIMTNTDSIDAKKIARMLAELYTQGSASDSGGVRK